MTDINEARRALEQSLGDLNSKYFDLLRQWFRLSKPMSKMEFETELRKLLTSSEQIRQHNIYMHSIHHKSYATAVKTKENTPRVVAFEIADFTEYVRSASPEALPPVELEYRSAASDLVVPDLNFMRSQVALHAWENGLDGAEDGVAEFMVHACQTFIKNIVTAMVTRKSGYRIRNGKLQHKFGIPVPDPFVRNTNNLRRNGDHTRDEGFVPVSRVPYESVEHENAFEYSCSKRRRTDGKLTVELLYETLKENPEIVGLHSIQSVNLLKLGMILDDE